jgi:hypothetical protein
MLPFWPALLLGWATGFITPQALRCQYGKTPALSSAKAQRDLGLDLIPYEQSMRDMVGRMESLGMLRGGSLGGRSSAAEAQGGAEGDRGSGSGVRQYLGWGSKVLMWLRGVLPWAGAGQQPPEGLGWKEE